MRRDQITIALRRARAFVTRARVTTVLDVLAAGAIASGAAMIYRPAGLIVGGLLLAGLSYLAARGDAEGLPE